ncbi:hypothetical protein GGR54DRAFT_265551 [Hypoxylon sp. NC1633]|nr:hypothetical protein GGR54DRAFT_265551 [Hypoxylon sp. NC1633]
MQAFRTRTACVARRGRRTALLPSRSYASESHDKDAHHDDHHDDHHHHAPEVKESLGASFYIFAAAIPVSILAYSASREGADGTPSRLSQMMRNFDYFNDWEARNTIRTNLIEQAAHDKHLLLNSGKNMHVELKTPELFNSGSPRAVPAGHYPDLAYVTEHYRKQAAAEEERKMQKLLAKRKAQEQQQQQQEGS